VSLALACLLVPKYARMALLPGTEGSTDGHMPTQSSILFDFDMPAEFLLKSWQEGIVPGVLHDSRYPNLHASILQEPRSSTVTLLELHAKAQQDLTRELARSHPHRHRRSLMVFNTPRSVLHHRQSYA
jgi:hypothetical protein